MTPRYTFRVEWSPEDGEYVGLVTEFPSLSFMAPSATRAFEGIVDTVDAVIDDMTGSGEQPPPALAERRYSGHISLRTSPAQHRHLTIEAAEQGVSLNQWINYKLG